MKKPLIEQLVDTGRGFWMHADEDEMPPLHAPDCVCEGVWEEFERLMDISAPGSDASMKERDAAALRGMFLLYEHQLRFTDATGAVVPGWWEH